MSQLPAHLRSDCAKCSALCCVVHPFDAAQGFGYNKPAHEPCRHLKPDFLCAIHASLIDQGFPGCASFDCYGAGQRVTQEHFPGRNWVQSPGIAAQIFDVYSRVRTLHELMAMLTLAIDRTKSDAARTQLEESCARLDTMCVDAAAVPDYKFIGQLKKQTLRLIRESARP